MYKSHNIKNINGFLFAGSFFFFWSETVFIKCTYSSLALSGIRVLHQRKYQVAKQWHFPKVHLGSQG